ncbi:MAG: DUF72 domain-containing protein [Rhodospirillales bacterium]|nr:DUF72 domain-containing protein [Rhodospirillales bacterium]MBN8906518.1 DUF72 domain-containing protein [Rhodospirillales bacterium]
MAPNAPIRVGIGGWTFPPWRETFYPPKLPHAQELAYAARHLTAIEVNGTFYRTQSPDSFARWHDETPDGFVFALKAPRYAVNRRVLAEAGPSIERFVASGLLRLGDKLGPINWQLAPTKRYEPEDFAAFLDLLPPSHEGVRLRHVVELRHESFLCAEVVAALRARNIAAVLADSDTHPLLADPTADFVYCRLQRSREGEPTGYPAAELDLWAQRLRAFAAGKGAAGKGTGGKGTASGTLPDLPLLAGPDPKPAPREVFAFFINGHKPKAPAAAMALIERLR